MAEARSAKFLSIAAELRDLADGAALGGVLPDALMAELAARARSSAQDDDWKAPFLSQLYIRRGGKLEEWSERRNICLAGEGAGEAQIGTGFAIMPSADGMLILGQGAKLLRVAMMETGGLIVVGDKARLDAVSLSCKGESGVMVGEETGATFIAPLDSAH